MKLPGIDVSFLLLAVALALAGCAILLGLSFTARPLPGPVPLLEE